MRPHASVDSRLPRWLCIAVVSLLMLWLQGCASGLHGGVFSSPGGPSIASAVLSFVNEDGSGVTTATSSASGRYSISLAPGRYYMLGGHDAFEDYNSAPGFAVVRSNTMGTANFFLRDPQVTTVLIVRHAEKLDPNSNAPTEPLSPAGEARAAALQQKLLRAGVTAVYSTDAVRTRATVAPLAAAFRLPIQIYSSTTALASEITTHHAGDVVLVAAHSNTATSVANALGATLGSTAIDDFDNLLVLSAPATGPAASVNVMNLQYGSDSLPDQMMNDKHAMTLLLVGDAAPATGALPQALQHALRKAGVSAIYTSAPGNPLTAPLAAELGLVPTTFNATDMASFAAQMLANHAQDTVVVGAGKEALRELIRQLGAKPFPVLYDSDVDHLVVVTRFASGATRVLPLRF